MKHPVIPCPHCNGTGAFKLPWRLNWCLQALDMAPSNRATCEWLHFMWSKQCSPERRKVGITVFNNRLEELRALGFVTRTRQGKFWIYQLKK